MCRMPEPRPFENPRRRCSRKWPQLVGTALERQPTTGAVADLPLRSRSCRSFRVKKLNSSTSPKTRDSRCFLTVLTAAPTISLLHKENFDRSEEHTSELQSRLHLV